MPEATNPVGIIGAGTMGAGIAQVAAASGWKVILHDLSQAAGDRAVERIASGFDRLIAKNKMTAAEAAAARDRVATTSDLADLAPCDLVIEAIVEQLDVKERVLREVATIVKPDVPLATNTSSLSISEIGRATGEPHRVIGMHFFNPAPVLKLVEVVRGAETSSEVADRVILIAEAWGKHVAQASDTPGFIVNRVARPYYLEAWRVLEDGYARVDVIDNAMKTMGGFRMGPFELTDLIGQDVNTATTDSVWQRLGEPARLAPSRLQNKLVDDGHLGRKSGRGAYAHDGENIVPAILVRRRALELDDELSAAVAAFCDGASEEQASDLERYLFARILASIINEAVWARHDGVASGNDIDTAMRLGTNYPKGPIEWAEQIGWPTVIDLLQLLNRTVVDGRFAPPESLLETVRP
jgi:3-hydroxybutyryl-CoA dehydrogenase